MATIPLGGHARDVVVSPGADHVYATTANSVSVIDRAHHIVANIPVGVEPEAHNGERRRVAGLCHGLRRFDVNHQRRGPYGENGWRPGKYGTRPISPHDNYVYLVHNQGRNCWVSVISDDGTTATVVPVHSYASALTFSPLRRPGCTSPHPNPGPPTNMATGRFR